MSATHLRCGMKARPHERFASTVRLTPAEVSAFARAAGDFNPLHHDPAAAARTRYRRLIASGTQTVAHLMALSATHFSERGEMVGLDFSFRFKKPVYADETIEMEWLVVRVTNEPQLKGDVVEMRGRIRNKAGETAVGAKGRVLVADRL
jgi:3-hydroxybutyryl-CoA dehydratase